MDGIAIAVAVVEALLDTEAYCLFVTHFHQITQLEEVYPCIRNIHMKGDDHDLGSKTNTPIVTHQLVSGSCELQSGYGIIMAEKCGFPDVVLDDARRFAVELSNLHILRFAAGEKNKNIIVLNSLLNHLLILEDSSLSPEGMKEYMHELHSKMTLDQFNTLKSVVDELYQEALLVDTALEDTEYPALVETDKEPPIQEYGLLGIIKDKKLYYETEIPTVIDASRRYNNNKTTKASPSSGSTTKKNVIMLEATMAVMKAETVGDTVSTTLLTKRKRCMTPSLGTENDPKISNE